ncbi:ATP F0F1 synthase subunit B [Chthonobacter rhizosphaerae]|uniref:F0F1 ATP synthase subunit B family protein n=1 Tax=Chthonobacter rhizosphaerae TaxID=2735553 RepID=UPI0015EF4E81|nr:ATP F0F1 synthase subunit B [Chthonobacter rhizosphaerae]
MFDATIWAFVGLILFFVLIGALGVFRTIGTMLDKRGIMIANELDEARRLREQAQALLVEYQGKRAAAEAEAAEIVENAKAEAARLAADAEVSLKDLVDRRTKATETKIAQAETQALAEVRALAADVAVRAATQILSTKVKGPVAADLLTRSIADVKARLN